MHKFYWTGIGSRETPKDISIWMSKISTGLDKVGGTLRSGGAPGADSHFENGLISRKEIYVPYSGFNKKQGLVMPITKEVIDIAKMAHPGFHRMKPESFAYKAHARNVYQILGQDLKTPSTFVVCWTPDGAEHEDECHSITVTGGTRTAIVIASQNNVPVFNLARPDALQRLQIFVKNKEMLPRENWSANPEKIEDIIKRKQEKKLNRYSQQNTML